VLAAALSLLGAVADALPERARRRAAVDAACRCVAGPDDGAPLAVALGSAPTKASGDLSPVAPAEGAEETFLGLGDLMELEEVTVEDFSAVSGAFSSVMRPTLTGIYLCHACSCQAIEGGHKTTPRQVSGALLAGGWVSHPALTARRGGAAAAADAAGTLVSMAHARGVGELCRRGALPTPPSPAPASSHLWLVLGWDFPTQRNPTPVSCHDYAGVRERCMRGGAGVPQATRRWAAVPMVGLKRRWVRRWSTMSWRPCSGRRHRCRAVAAASSSRGGGGGRLSSQGWCSFLHARPYCPCARPF
jgi:hypothetical protein